MNQIDGTILIYQGSKLAVGWLNEEALCSYLRQLEGLSEKMQKQRTAVLYRYIVKLADDHRLNKLHFRSEGDLPNGSVFYAFKPIPIRAYGWHSDKRNGDFLISHCITKKKDGLDARDTDRVCANWNHFEEAT